VTSWTATARGRAGPQARLCSDAAYCQNPFATGQDWITCAILPLFRSIISMWLLLRVPLSGNSITVTSAPASRACSATPTAVRKIVGQRASWSMKSL